MSLHFTTCHIVVNHMSSQVRGFLNLQCALMLSFFKVDTVEVKRLHLAKY